MVAKNVRIVGTGFILALTMVSLAGAATAGGYKVLYSFCKKGGYCTDGSGPRGGLIQDSAGNLYGTTVDNGQHGGGVVFELLHEGAHWQYQRIWSFCARSCADSYSPASQLVMDVNGNLYGTTSGQGSDDCTPPACGAAFELTRNGSKWSLKILHTFNEDGVDGIYPLGLSYTGVASGVPYDGTSPLFGTTPRGGPSKEGVVFKLSQQNGTWSEEVIHDFCGAGCTTDGYLAQGPLTDSGNGNFVGSTNRGGTNDQGTVYAISPDGSEKVIYNFCDGVNGCPAYVGFGPTGRLIRASTGNLYGIAGYGTPPYAGVVWELSQGGYNKVWDCGSKKHWGDCVSPVALTLRSDSDMIGIANSGGKPFVGTIFDLTCCSEGGGGWNETTLHTFCKRENCPDGAYPEDDALLQDGQGNIYGTAIRGGRYGHGVVFELTP